LGSIAQTTDWAQNLWQGIVMKNSLNTRVSRMGVGSFVNIKIFVMKYSFFQFVYNLYFFESLKSKSKQMLGSQKGNSGVSFNDTLLNFGLWGLYSVHTPYACTDYYCTVG